MTGLGTYTSNTLLDGHARSEVPLETAVPALQFGRSSVGESLAGTSKKTIVQKLFSVRIDPAYFVPQTKS